METTAHLADWRLQKHSHDVIYIIYIIYIAHARLTTSLANRGAGDYVNVSGILSFRNVELTFVELSNENATFYILLRFGLNTGTYVYLPAIVYTGEWRQTAPRVALWCWSNIRKSRKEEYYMWEEVNRLTPYCVRNAIGRVMWLEWNLTIEVKMTWIAKWPYYHISVLTNLIHFAVSKIIWDYPHLGLFRVIATATCL